MNDYTGSDSIRLTARGLRLAMVQNLYDGGHLTEEESKEILSGRLDPDNPDSIVNDSDQLKLTHSPTAPKPPFLGGR